MIISREQPPSARHWNAHILGHWIIVNHLKSFSVIF